MENEKFIGSSTEKIRNSLQDYYNDFIALNVTLMTSGIDGVRKIIKNGYRIATFEEYLQKYRKKNRETMSVRDQENPVFIKKAKILNELANRINSLGENVDEQIVKETVKKAEKIVYN